jgi:polar amino acid transport system substrate-binding protein
MVAELRKRGTLRVATLAGNPPYSSFKSDGTASGYDIEIARALAAGLKVQPVFTTVDGPGRITALLDGSADVAVADFTDTIERSTLIAFTRPYVVVGSVFMVPRTSKLTTVDDANKAGVTLAVTKGTTLEETGRRILPNATIMTVETATEGFNSVRAGKADLQILDSLQNAAFLDREGRNYRNLPGNWSYEEICIGVPPGDVDWLRIVDTFVRQLVNSGENARLFKRFFGYDIPPF